MEADASKTLLETLKKMVVAMGGKVLAASGHSVGFIKNGSYGQTLYKLVLEGDDVILYHVSGPAKGRRVHVTSLKKQL